jgi:hypothetical protein
MKTSPHSAALLAVLSPMIFCGCSTVNSTTVTKGVIQCGLAENGGAAPGVASKETLGVVQVQAFKESRARNCREQHNLWLAYIPLACVGTYWEKPDWLIWNSYHSAYKSVGQDMAEALCLELEATGLFEKVLRPGEAGATDWVIEGDLE